MLFVYGLTSEDGLVNTSHATVDDKLTSRDNQTGSEAIIVVLIL